MYLELDFVQVLWGVGQGVQPSHLWLPAAPWRVGRVSAEPLGGQVRVEMCPGEPPSCVECVAPDQWSRVSRSWGCWWRPVRATSRPSSRQHSAAATWTVQTTTTGGWTLRTFVDVRVLGCYVRVCKDKVLPRTWPCKLIWTCFFLHKLVFKIKLLLFTQSFRRLCSCLVL